jgi:hypothetical protein
MSPRPYPVIHGLNHCKPEVYPTIPSYPSPSPTSHLPPPASCRPSSHGALPIIIYQRSN